MKFDLGYINKLLVVRLLVEGNKVEYTCLKLKFRKGEITFEQQEGHFQDLKELIKKVSNKVPFVLHFEGKGVISRNVKLGTDYRQTLLMNASESDFYFTEYVQEDQLFYSFMRRDLAEEHLLGFKENGCQLIGVSSGPFTTGLLVPFIQKLRIKLKGYELVLREKKIAEAPKSDEEGFDQVKIGEQIIKSTLLPSLAAGAQFFQPSEQLTLPQDEVLNVQQLNEAKQRNIFRRFSGGMLIFFLAILSGNYLYLQSLNEQIVDNSLELSNHESQLAQLGKLKEEKERKENLLRSSGLLNKSFLSFYLMELGNSAPSGITFDEIQIRPLLAEIKDKHKIEFMEKLIMLNGKSKSSQVLQKWIEVLEAREWVENVEIVHYTYTKNLGNFELQILLN
ncbi:MAG: hypothetical protein MI810_22905 [Flavobacteriales bacterium]|nr:hypothetical protein [Flavobacteriales bacterium]